MSLGVVVKGSEGIVLAADSRVTLIAGNPQQPNFQLPVNFDNATKLLTFREPNKWIGAVTYGDAVIGSSMADLRTAQSFIPEFEVGLPEERLDVEDFASRLSDFFTRQWQTRVPANQQSSGMTFVVGGYDIAQPYGRVFQFTVPNAPSPVEQAAGDFGITVGGQHELVARLLQGYDPRVLEIARQTCNLSNQQVAALGAALVNLRIGIPFPVLPLQDCIDLALFLIRTTTGAQNLTIGLRGVGGAIDVAVITSREGLRIIQQKRLAGEERARR